MSDAPSYFVVTLTIPKSFSTVRFDLPEMWSEWTERLRREWIDNRIRYAVEDAEPSIVASGSLHYHDGTEVDGDGSRDDSEVTL